VARQSSIEWTETTWNPVVGCTKVSTGCANCYAERMAKRLAAISKSIVKKGNNPGRTAHYEKVVNQRGHWTGEVSLNEDALNDPISWVSPRTIFVNSMSDLFHSKVPFAFIHRVFQVMKRCPQHTFQVLTKRPERAADLAKILDWPSNIWIGTSVENAEVLNRVSHLQQICAHTRFLSIEPLLGPIPMLSLEGIHWVIVGGESGPGARVMKAEWVTHIRDMCVKAGVPFFFKQWGGANKKSTGRLLDGLIWDEMPKQEAMAYA